MDKKKVKATNPSHPHAPPLAAGLVDEGQTQADKMQRHQADEAPEDDADYPGPKGLNADADCQTGHADEGDEPAIASEYIWSHLSGKTASHTRWQTSESRRPRSGSCRG